MVYCIDPVGGAPDTRRWPLAPSGTSLYWTGLNKGKRSVILDLRNPAGQDALQKLITAPGEGGGILLTNQAGRGFMSYPALAELRSDVIVVGNQAPEFAEALTQCRADQIILDLVRLQQHGKEE